MINDEQGHPVPIFVDKKKVPMCTLLEIIPWQVKRCTLISR